MSMDLSKHGVRVLILSMVAMVFCFTVWVSLSPIAKQFQLIYGLSLSQKAMLISIPMLMGSIMRIPLGILTDRIGGRKVFTALMLFMVIPTLGVSFTSSFSGLVFWAFFMGMAGTSFAVGIAYVSKFFPPHQQGLVLGIVALGNFGTAVASFTVPSLAESFGIQNSFWILAILMFVMAVVFWIGTVEMPLPKEKKTLMQSLVILKYMHTWFLALLYFITFGVFMFFAIYLPTFLQDLFAVTMVKAGVLTAVFLSVATLCRPVGGWLADKLGAGKVLVVVYAMVITTTLFLTFGAQTPAPFLFISYVLSFFLGLGNGAVFKLVPAIFPQQTGAVTGIVGAIGGLGGFGLPLVFGNIKATTGFYQNGFLFVSALALCCLVITLRRYLRETAPAVVNP